MASVFRLSDGTTTINLLDGDNIDVREGAVDLPPPPPKIVWGGDNRFRDGADLVDLTYGNRKITALLRIKGANHDAIIANILGLEKMLIDAANADRKSVV